MRGALHESWLFILGKLSTSTLSLLLFSVIIPAVVFVATSLYTWRTSGHRVPLEQTLSAAVVPTVFTIAVTVFALLCLLGWGVVANLRAEYVSLRKSISERDIEISQLRMEQDKALKWKTGKLTIHSAIYGTGEINDVSVLEVIRNMTRDGLVIPVDNNLIKGRDDPAPMQPKRLRIEYSYGDSPKHAVERPESRPGIPSRLVLPQDTEIARLLQVVHVAREAAASATQAQHRLEQTISELDCKHRKQVASLQKDWPKEWKEQSEKFNLVSKHGIRADWHDTSAGKGWRICGGNTEGNRHLEVLCKMAGNLLIASPQISATIPPHIKTEADPTLRWLYYLKENRNGYESEHLEAYEVLDGKKRFVHMGTIRDLGMASANQCLDIAGQEFSASI
jgi:hypothetical protein